MDLCIHRISHREHNKRRSYCRDKQQPCGFLRQIICTAPDAWPIWTIVLVGVLVITVLVLA